VVLAHHVVETGFGVRWEIGERAHTNGDTSHLNFRNCFNGVWHLHPLAPKDIPVPCELPLSRSLMLEPASVPHRFQQPWDRRQKTRRPILNDYRVTGHLASSPKMPLYSEGYHGTWPDTRSSRLNSDA
jgi:hypothetical protein